MKKGIIKVEGKVTKDLSNGFYEVILKNQHRVIANVSGKMRRFSIRVLTNDTVEMEMSIYDNTKGRIVRRR